MATGAVFFDVLVASSTRDFQGADVGRLPRRLRRISLTGIGVAIVPGAAWLIVITLGLAEGDADARVSGMAPWSRGRSSGKSAWSGSCSPARFSIAFGTFIRARER